MNFYFIIGSNHFYLLNYGLLFIVFFFFGFYMIRLLIRIILYPFRILFYVYHKLTYYFTGERIVYIKIPSKFTYFEKTGIIKILTDKEEHNYFLFLLMLDKIGEEEKIKKVILEIPSLEALEWNQIEDIIKVIEKLREKGKVIHAYVEEGGIKTLLVASSSNFRYCGDWAQFITVLPHFEQFYLGDFFKNLGIQFDVFTAGKYKSAGEMYQRNKISPSAKENIIELIQDKRSEILKQFLKTPNMNQSDIKKIWNLFLNQSIVSATELFQLGFFHQFMDQVQLIDYVSENKSPFIPNEIEHNIQGQGDAIKKDKDQKYEEKTDKKIKVITQDQFLKMNYKKNYKLLPFITKPESIALVVMDGIILRGDEDDEAKSGTINAKGYIKIIEELKESKEKAVIIFVNSPGGMSDASEFLYQHIRKLSRIKPVYILQGNVAASGGYYISCAGNKIYAYNSTITGSIGVLRLRPTLYNLYKKLKINKSKLMFDKTTEIFSESSPLKKESKELLQKTTLDAYQIFLDRVARGRGKLIEQVKHFAEGRVYSSFRFKEAGLLDGITNFIDLIQIIKQELGIKKEKKVMLNFYPLVKFDLKEILNVKNLLTDNRIDILNRGLNIFKFLQKDLYISIDALNLYFEKWIK
ncbi:MAG: serine protease [Leptospiraceae bacterium]|nr:MAG: serine protease [Leptospiraceae bacterium]GIX43530.1 MAG: serine protease [Leptospiraceae bacterium]